MMNIEIARIEIAKLDVKKGDTVVLSVPRGIPLRELERVVTRIKDLLPGGVKCLLLPSGSEVRVIRDEDQAGQGR